MPPSSLIRPAESSLYYKKAAPVSALQISVELGTAILQGKLKAPPCLRIRTGNDGAESPFYVNTREGSVSLNFGDWLVGPGAGGEYWAVGSDIFEATYASWPPAEAVASQKTAPSLFKDLPLGARFSYLDGNAVWVVLGKSGCGLIAEEVAEQSSRQAQSVCSAAESPLELEHLRVLWRP